MRTAITLAAVLLIAGAVMANPSGPIFNVGSVSMSNMQDLGGQQPHEQPLYPDGVSGTAWNWMGDPILLGDLWSGDWWYRDGDYWVCSEYPGRLLKFIGSPPNTCIDHGQRGHLAEPIYSYSVQN